MGPTWKLFQRWTMDRDTLRWALGLVYIFAIASIWIAASYIVQSVEDAGVSPFLITYICNSLFLLYIPLVEISNHFDNSVDSQQPGSLETTKFINADNNNTLVDAKGRWTRARVAKVSLLICPFWFFGQLFFNLSLKYTTVTSNTILSSTSSLFTFLVSLAFLGEVFSWVKLISVVLCMGGTIIVSLADSSGGGNTVATRPLLGDALALVSAALYAVYITLIRKKLPDGKSGEGEASTAQFLGYLGLFNLLIFLPVALLLAFTKVESFHKLRWKQLGLIVGKGLLDNVLSDYLWVKATQLTTTTVATAGLSIQVPIAAVVDSITGKKPRPLEYLGAAFVMVGFAGINVPTDASSQSQGITEEHHKDEVIGLVEMQEATELKCNSNAISVI